MDEEKDLYNLPIAAFTFGKNGQPLSYYSSNDIQNISKNNAIINKNKDEQIKNNNNITIESKESKDSNKFSNDDSFKRFSFKNIINRHNKKINLNKNNIFHNNNFVFIDKEDNNSSYIKIILYALSYMPLFNDFIINEWNINVEENYNNNSNNNVEQILLLIREILMKIEKIRNKNKYRNNNTKINNIINIEQLKENLCELFKSKNKFMKNSSDDPLDFLYIIFNFFHDLNPIISKKRICNECFCHKNISIVLYKLYECECRAQSKPIININNYFLDIPINIIINKFISNKLKDMNQMLFIYYQLLIQNVKIKGDCPIYGKNCQFNKVHKKYILKKSPSYLIFNLEIDFFKNKELFYSLNNILKTFVLIPHIFNINTLFNTKQNNGNTKYELIGILFLKISKIYSCIFKSKDNEIFYYYEDNNFTSFNNYYDIILFSIKNGNIPIALIYQKIINNIKFNINYELTEEKINKLEKYVKNTNNLNQNLKNKIRTRENIIADNYGINYSINNNNNASYSENYTSSRYSNSIKSYNSFQKNEYLCNHCERINKIENVICFFCGFDNSNLINNNNNKNIPNNKTKKLKSNIIIKKKLILEKDKISKTQNNNSNYELDEIQNEYKKINPQVLKYFGMHPQNISSKEEIDNNNNSTQKQKLSSKLINKIPHYNNNYNNNFKTEKKSTNLSINNSPKISKKNLYINNIGNKSLKAMNKSAKNGFINYTNRNINNNELNIFKRNDFHSEQNEQYNNNQLNINLKINNNNNFNIFEFGNKKNLIKLNDYDNKYETEENYFNIHNNEKLFKKINSSKSTKNKDLKKFNKNKIINYNIPNDNWTCIYCLNKNNNNIKKCLYCKRKRAINNMNKSPRNKSLISHENRINFNNMLIGQMSTKNSNRFSKI